MKMCAMALMCFCVFAFSTRAIEIQFTGTITSPSPHPNDPSAGDAIRAAVGDSFSGTVFINEAGGWGYDEKAWLEQNILIPPTVWMVLNIDGRPWTIGFDPSFPIEIGATLTDDSFNAFLGGEPWGQNVFFSVSLAGPGLNELADGAVHDAAAGSFMGVSVRHTPDYGLSATIDHVQMVPDLGCSFWLLGIGWIVLFALSPISVCKAAIRSSRPLNPTPSHK